MKKLATAVTTLLFINLMCARNWLAVH